MRVGMQLYSHYISLTSMCVLFSSDFLFCHCHWLGFFSHKTKKKAFCRIVDLVTSLIHWHHFEKGSVIFTGDSKSFKCHALPCSYMLILYKCETYTKYFKWGKLTNKHALPRCWPCTSKYTSDKIEPSACTWLCTVWQGQHRIDTMGFLSKTLRLFTQFLALMLTLALTTDKWLRILVARSTPFIFPNIASAVSRQLSAPSQEKSRLILLSHIVEIWTAHYTRKSETAMGNKKHIRA